MNISLVPIEHVNEVWDDVKDYLRAAILVTNGRYMLYDVYNSVQQSKMQLWIAFDEDRKIYGCQVTTITDYPSRRILTSLFTGGTKIRSWRNEMMDVLIHWAEDNECSGIEGYGKKAWIKLLEPYGIKESMTVFEKEL